ncbi:RHS repeat-associated core domain-containing protein, partial [Erwinia sorbitola]
KRELAAGFRPRVWKYRWNGQGQLAELLTPERRRWRYEYDAFGRRIRKFEVIPGGGADERRLPLRPHAGEDAEVARGEARRTAGYDYFWCGEQMVEETPLYADGTPADEGRIRWLYQPGAVSPFARYERGRLHYVVSDHLGSVRELLSEEGKAVWFARSTTWGRSRLWGFAANDEVRAGCQWRFPGQYEDDESGLHYNRFRYYDPDTAQYISPDPIGLAGGINPYGYVHNPLGWIDPLGLTACSVPKGFSRKDKITQRWVDKLSGKKPADVDAFMTSRGWTRHYPQAGRPDAIQHTQYVRTTKSGATYKLDYHPGGNASQPNIHGNDYWKIYKVNNGEDIVFGRIGHGEFKNYDLIKDSPVYIDGTLINGGL